MWNSTRLMAEAIAVGIQQEDPEVTVKLLNAAKVDKNDIVTEIQIQSYLSRLLHSEQQIPLCHGRTSEMVKGLKFKQKKAAPLAATAGAGKQ